MKRYSGKWFAVIGVAVLALISSGVFLCTCESKKSSEQTEEIAGPIKWYTYDEGVALGKSQGKKIYIYFWADWCTFCEKMEKETLSKPLVSSYLNKNFISIKVNSDKEKETASQYFVRGFPTSWFLTEDGEKISNLPGYVPPDMFLQVLEFLYSDSYKKMSFGDYIKSK